MAPGANEPQEWPLKALADPVGAAPSDQEERAAAHRRAELERLVQPVDAEALEKNLVAQLAGSRDGSRMPDLHPVDPRATASGAARDVRAEALRPQVRLPRAIAAARAAR